MSRPDALGELKTVELPQGTIRYHERGTGPTLVFAHGVLVNATLWRDVVPALAGQFRCITPDLPFGCHALPLRSDADRSPGGVARLLADLLDALDLRDVTLVGNDTGGAICQLLIARHPARIARLVLTNCDAYEAFFPLLIRPLHDGARLFGARFVDALAVLLRARAAQRALAWTVARRRPDAATLDAYFEPFLREPGVRRDLAAFLAAVSNRYTLEAAATFPHFRRPVLIAWGRGDVIFSARYARRLARDFPCATLQFIPRARTFVPEDQPAILAGLIAEFVRDAVTA